MITRKNLLYSTFIGLNVEITQSTQPDLIDLKGKIVDETKNLILIKKLDGNEVKIPKISSTFKFTTESGKSFEIKGEKILFRPHERPKKI